MIDVSQWRASIGLWNYCQAASSRPANGHHSHSFKAAVDSKSGSTTSGEKTSKLPAALSLIVSLLLSLLRYTKLNFIPPTATIGSSSDLIYYLVLFLLLLLSGDVELNPGPMIDDQPDIFLLLQWLEPLVDWKPFGLLLPGITQHEITTIEHCQVDAKHHKLALFTKWLNTYPTGTWRDVLNALTKREEINLLQTINDQLQVHQCTGGTTDAPTSTVPVVSIVSSSVSVITKPITSTTSGNTPSAILRMNYATLVDAITNSLQKVTDTLYAKGLIPQQTKQEMLVPAVDNYTKAANLMNVIEKQLESSLNPEQYLIDICHVLINQQHHTLTDIATSILHQLGQPIPDNVSSHIVLPSPVDNISNTPVTNIRGNKLFNV
uniref:Death domain-containing protein n=1 Tax=Amphimedon queenslandica TaxID=400682 RepID=A0A1X7SZR3_AMPQE